MNWDLLDEQWLQRHDDEQLTALERALDAALSHQSGATEYAILW